MLPPSAPLQTYATNQVPFYDEAAAPDPNIPPHSADSTPHSFAKQEYFHQEASPVPSNPAFPPYSHHQIQPSAAPTPQYSINQASQAPSTLPNSNHQIYSPAFQPHLLVANQASIHDGTSSVPSFPVPTQQIPPQYSLNQASQAPSTLPYLHHQIYSPAFQPHLSVANQASIHDGTSPLPSVPHPGFQHLTPQPGPIALNHKTSTQYSMMPSNTENYNASQNAASAAPPRPSGGEFARKAFVSIRQSTNNIKDYLVVDQENTTLTGKAFGKMKTFGKVVKNFGFQPLYQQTFKTGPDEKVKKTFACHLSSTAGSVAGTLYLTDLNVAFCSDNPVPHLSATGEQITGLYKIMVPLERIVSVHPIVATEAPSRKFIQIRSLDSNDFWFEGFVNYDKASAHLVAIVTSNNIAGLPLS